MKNIKQIRYQKNILGTKKLDKIQNILLLKKSKEQELPENTESLRVFFKQI